MKLVYAVDKGSYNSINHLGVKKKVQAQISLFQKNGIESQLFEYEWIKGFPRIEISADTDFLYFRRIEPSFKFVHTLRRLKKINPNLKIIMEIPTYPFAKEQTEKQSLKRKISIFFGEKFMRRFIDRIILIGQQTKIEKLYGIDVIHANNGIDYEKVPLKKFAIEKPEGINVICVSGCYFWHGYDRFIEGMANYYREESNKVIINFHIVGDGKCFDDYVAAAKKYGLYNKRIFIYGNKQGKELDSLYNISDIAINSLGSHRKGMHFASSLKAREYAAKGLPIVSSVRLDLENEQTNPYILFVPEDETAIDMISIIDFYNQIYESEDAEEVAEKIRNSFYRFSDWQYTYEGVVSYMKGK